MAAPSATERKVETDEDRKLKAKQKAKKDASEYKGGEREQAFANLLDELDIRMVVFDLDQTACKQHSGGVMPKTRQAAYNNAISPDFKKVVPVLLRRGFHLSICTFTDDHYLNDSRFNDGKHIAGDKLIEDFLDHTYLEETCKQFKYNVGFNPQIHKERKIPVNKNYHLDELLKKFNADPANKEKLELGQCILFDDTKKNIDEAKGFKAVQVARTGFKLPIERDDVKNRS